MTQPPPQPAFIYLDPPLAPSEIEFLSGFSSRGDIRRVWPGQPSAHCPWRVSEDGRSLRLDFDAIGDDASEVAPWLRFLSQEFLAPSSIDAMHAALAQRLRGGHQLTGTVMIHGVREVSADRNRISERVLAEERDAVVLQFGGARRGEAGPSSAGQGRCVER
ncbi:hypothetical protein BH09ACT12_BH09ACT12_16150 [soil metagenome]